MSATFGSPLLDQSGIAGQLHGRLLDLDFPAFACCLCRLLEALGYQNVKLAGRREWKGYNQPGGGGYDLEATLPGGLVSRRVVAQVKQFDGLRVHQRSVDELRGTCLRVGAAEGLLVTTSAFSKVVRQSEALERSGVLPASAGASVALVRLLDGDALVRLLIRHRLGVREHGLGKLNLLRGMRPMRDNELVIDQRLVIDEAFFAGCAASQAAVPRSARPAAAKAAGDKLTKEKAAVGKPQLSSAEPPPALMKWRVTVRVSAGHDLTDHSLTNHDSTGNGTAGAGPQTPQEEQTKEHGKQDQKQGKQAQKQGKQTQKQGKSQNEPKEQQQNGGVRKQGIREGGR